MTIEQFEKFTKNRSDLETARLAKIFLRRSSNQYTR
ncbi:hypothetical protein WCWAEYFT_CDS0026 [Vibrio phage VB_VaC_TDDLMA]